MFCTHRQKWENVGDDSFPRKFWTGALSEIFREKSYPQGLKSKKKLFLSFFACFSAVLRQLAVAANRALKNLNVKKEAKVLFGKIERTTKNRLKRVVNEHVSL